MNSFVDRLATSAFPSLSFAPESLVSLCRPSFASKHLSPSKQLQDQPLSCACGNKVVICNHQSSAFS